MNGRPHGWWRALMAAALTFTLLAPLAGADDGGEAHLGFRVGLEGGGTMPPLEVWVAAGAGGEALFGSTDPDGEVQLDLPPGEYTIALVFRNTEYPLDLAAFEPADRISADGLVTLADGEDLMLAVTLPDDFALDTDGDGAPDWWEPLNGFDPAVPDAAFGQDGLGDPFTDGSVPPDDEPGGWVLRAPHIVLAVLLAIMSVAAGMAYSKIHRDRVLDHNTRECIFNYIKDKPGVHLRGIKKDLGLAMGVLNHHLRRLEDEELIKSRAERQYKRYYPYYYSMKDHPILSRGQREVYKTIVENPGISPPQVAVVMGRSRRNVYNHVNSLEKMGLIRTRKDGKTLKCYIVDAA